MIWLHQQVVSVGTHSFSVVITANDEVVFLPVFCAYHFGLLQIIVHRSIKIFEIWDWDYLFLNIIENFTLRHRVRKRVEIYVVVRAVLVERVPWNSDAKLVTQAQRSWSKIDVFSQNIV